MGFLEFIGDTLISTFSKSENWILFIFIFLSVIGFAFFYDKFISKL